MSGLIFVARQDGASFQQVRALTSGQQVDILGQPLSEELQRSLSAPPPEALLGINNPTLLPALAGPLHAFLIEVSGQPEFAAPCRMHRDDAELLAVHVSPYRARVVDLRRVPLDSFLLSVASARAREQLTGALGLEVLRYALAGIDFFSDHSGAYGYCIESAEDAPCKIPFLPRGPHLRGAWLLYTRLSLELQLGPRYYSALDCVQRALGPAPHRALARASAAVIEALVQDLARDYRLTGDAISALLHLPDWQRAGGLQRLQRVRDYDRQRVLASR